jgi:hypothetical protein
MSQNDTKMTDVDTKMADVETPPKWSKGLFEGYYMLRNENGQLTSDLVSYKHAFDMVEANLFNIWHKVTPQVGNLDSRYMCAVMFICCINDYALIQKAVFLPDGEPVEMDQPGEQEEIWEINENEKMTPQGPEQCEFTWDPMHPTIHEKEKDEVKEGWWAILELCKEFFGYVDVPGKATNNPDPDISLSHKVFLKRKLDIVQETWCIMFRDWQRKYRQYPQEIRRSEEHIFNHFTIVKDKCFIDDIDHKNPKNDYEKDFVECCKRAKETFTKWGNYVDLEKSKKACKRPGFNETTWLDLRDTTDWWNGPHLNSGFLKPDYFEYPIWD